MSCSTYETSNLPYAPVLTVHRVPQARARDPESRSRNRPDPDALRNSAERGSSAGRRRPIGFVLAEWNEVFGRAVSIPSRPRLGMQRRRRAPGGTSQPPCSSCMTGACGAGAVQHADSPQPPSRCPICEDERQYVGWQGQQWTTLEELSAEGFRSELRELEPGLAGIGVTPALAIGQRALLVQTEAGNVLWDCPGYLDDAAVERVRQLGGLAGISASYPHFYGCLVEWSHAFDAPVYLPRADEPWIMRPDPAVRLWEDRLEVVPGVTLVQCGGHFAGSAVLHWAGGAAGRGALLVGDTITVVSDRRYVSFMRSYPNFVPLPASEVDRIAQTLEPLAFDRIYGGWWDRDVLRDAAEAVRASARRYVAWVEGMPRD